MTEKSKLGPEYLKELESEAPAARKCLERIPEKLFFWKPHEKSMTMGDLSLLVAEIPNWIVNMIVKTEIDFGTFKHIRLRTTTELVNHFDENLNAARKVLESVTDDMLDRSFVLKNQGQLLFSTPLKEIIAPTINHFVHHRGQLTVYMRLNNIPVPSIYGPSADEQGY